MHTRHKKNKCIGNWGASWLKFNSVDNFSNSSQHLHHSYSSISTYNTAENGTKVSTSEWAYDSTQCGTYFKSCNIWKYIQWKVEITCQYETCISANPSAYNRCNRFHCVFTVPFRTSVSIAQLIRKISITIAKFDHVLSKVLASDFYSFANVTYFAILNYNVQCLSHFWHQTSILEWWWPKIKCHAWLLTARIRQSVQ